MLWLEHQVVAAMSNDDDDALRRAIEQFVESTVDAMPAHVRLGVALESVVLGILLVLRRGLRPTPELIQSEIEVWERSFVGFVRLYPKLFTSLVIFARYELGPT